MNFNESIQANIDKIKEASGKVLESRRLGEVPPAIYQEIIKKNMETVKARGKEYARARTQEEINEFGIEHVRLKLKG